MKDATFLIRLQSGIFEVKRVCVNFFLCYLLIKFQIFLKKTPSISLALKKIKVITGWFSEEQNR